MSYAAFRWTFRLTSRSPGNSSLGIGALAEWDAKGWDALPLAPKELSRLFPALRQTAKAAERWTAKNPPEAIRDIIRYGVSDGEDQPIGGGMQDQPHLVG